MKEIIVSVIVILLVFIMPVVWAGQGVQGLVERAAGGDARSQYEIGAMYRFGNSVPADSARAFEWMSLAANQGYPAAQFVLGHMYSKGEGCGIDYVASYQWFFLAARLGQEGAFAAGGDVSEMMALDQLNLAQERAYSWMRDHSAGQSQVNYGVVSVTQ